MRMNDRTTRSAESSRAHAPLVVVLAAVCVGIVLDRIAGLSIAWWCCGAAAAWIVWWLLWRASFQQTGMATLLVSLACTAAAWHHGRWSLYDRDEVGLFAREVVEPAAIEVRATSGPRRIPAPPPDPLATIARADRTRLEVDVLAIRDGDTWRNVSGVATLFVDGHLEGVRPGDRLRVFAGLGAIARPANPGEFDFAGHSRIQRRLCSLSCEFPECITILAPGSRAGIRRMVDFLRASGDALLWRNLGPRRSGLAAAMFLGAREELQPDEAQAFLETGTIHLLVISGLNVGILAGCLFLAMRLGLVRRTWALALVSIICVLYAVTTDAQPPVVRATVMVLVACLAMVLGRRALDFNSIAAAGLVVLALNPAELFQSGTQLSFLSVAALAWFAERRTAGRNRDPLDRLIAATRPRHVRLARRVGRAAARGVMVSVLIWLVICPLVMARFHLVSPVAILLGPLLAIPVTAAMMTGFGIFALGWLMPPLANLLGKVCDANLMFMETSVNLSRNWPGSHFWVSGPGNWWLAVFYAALAYGALGGRWTPPRRWCLGLLAAWVAAGVSLSLVWPRDATRLECTFLSVGHGAAVVVELPGGETLLYDSGRLGSPTSAARAVAGYLWARGIKHLDAVVVSHADADHYNALPALLDRFSVGAVYVSPVMFLEPSPALAALRSAINRAGVPLGEVWSGDRLRSAGGARIEVLHPPRGGVLGSDNANSIVLAIEYQGRRLLLTGDLESPGLDDVMAEEPYDCDVLLAPHHGSAFSDPPGFAGWSTPEWTVISGGWRDRPEGVADAYAARGSRVLHTATSGAVRVSIVDGQMDVERYVAQDR
jgi:competence protein ComEC